MGSELDRQKAAAPVCEQRRSRQRVPLVGSCPYTMSESIGQKSIMVHQGAAVSINISSGGLLLLLAQAPQLQQVLEIQVPTPYDTVSTRTLAEVRWTRQIQADADNSMYLAGVKFLFGPQASSSEMGVEHPV